PGTTLSERKQTLIDGGGKVISGIEISNDFDQIAGSSRNAVNGEKIVFDFIFICY
ncbi:hypothetical protein S245_001953, partial [Arachis hypogaea]